MIRTYLLIIAIVLILMGIAGLIPYFTWATEPLWHSIVKIAIGLFSIALLIADGKKSQS